MQLHFVQVLIINQLASLHLTEHDEQKIKTQKTCIELTLLSFYFTQFSCFFNTPANDDKKITLN